MTKKDSLDKKWEIHKVIQEAIQTAHTSPSPQTLKILEDIQGTLKENYSKREIDEKERDTMERFDRQDKVLNQLLTQVTYTNGQVKLHAKVLLVVGSILATLLVTNGSELLTLFKAII
jgi:vacuolar-type H+-ATPase catalytic subunit A/Vma1